MSTTLIVALIFSALVFAGCIFYYKRNPFGEKETYELPVNWKHTLVLTAIAFGGTLFIGWLSNL